MNGKKGREERSIHKRNMRCIYVNLFHRESDTHRESFDRETFI